MIRQFIPKEYHQLLDYISPAAFKVIDWKRATSQLFDMSKRAIDSSLARGLAESNQKLFPPQVILAGQTPADAVRNETLSDTRMAELILDVYFSQLFSEKGCLLDLRLSNFAKDQHSVRFNPGSFVHTFKDEFREGMLRIYEGYYFGRRETMQDGMRAVGLITSNDPRKVEEIEQLLFSHFGRADQGPILFDLESFRESFHNLFLYLKEQNIRLSSDFLFLGIYLITLYLSLSKLGQPVDVKKSFTDVCGRNMGGLG
jgi:predicted unusual protein kinase regulating ubiquinone biosynthesis (AarF/ABC1/UbiB family)